MDDAASNAPENGAGNRLANGRFVKGHALPGPGRPRGATDLRAVVEGMKGGIENVLQRLFRVLMKQACKGDVAAARVLLDRLCGPVRADVSIEMNTRPTLEELIAQTVATNTGDEEAAKDLEFLRANRGRYRSRTLAETVGASMRLPPPEPGEVIT